MERATVDVAALPKPQDPKEYWAERDIFVKAGQLEVDGTGKLVSSEGGRITSVPVVRDAAEQRILTMGAEFEELEPTPEPASVPCEHPRRPFVASDKRAHTIRAKDAASGHSTRAYSAARGRRD